MVEDDALLRASIVDALGGREDIDVVVSGHTGRDLIAVAKDGGVDVAVLDVHLGSGPSGFDIARTLRQESPIIGIVFLSSVKDPRLLGFTPESLPRGARYLLKSEVSDIDRLVTTIQETFSDVFGDGDNPAPSLPFTGAQIEILRLVAAGHSNAAIAKERGVGERAVEVAVSRLAKHLGLRELPGANQRVHIATTFFREMGWSP
jgi:DNA-binding NarL/FixJ family response regulator